MTFGLATFPDKVPVTVHGRRLGPLYFHAPEMLQNPIEALPAAADVYSLAKTLWVLATGQAFPLPGELRADTPVFRIGSYCSHERVSSLEVLLDTATRVEPAQRPTMAEFEAELRQWLDPPIGRGAASALPSTLSRLRELAQRGRIDAGRRQEITDRQHGTLAALRGKLMEIQHELSIAGVHCEVDSLHTSMHEFLGLGKHSRDQRATLRGGNYVRISGPHGLLPWSPGEPIGPTLAELSSGFWVNGLEDGDIEIIAAHVLIEFGERGDRHSVLWEKATTVRSGSPAEAHVAEQLARSLRDSMDEAIRMLTVTLEARF